MNHDLPTEALAAIAQQIFDLQTRLDVQEAMVCLLAGRLDLSPEHIREVMERLTIAKKEKLLLEIGDTNPLLADLLGYKPHPYQ